MPKPVALTPNLVDAPSVMPKAAAAARTTAKSPEPEQKIEQLPLQLRLPRDQVKAIKVAAAGREQTISEFMLACFHAFMASAKHD